MDDGVHPPCFYRLKQAEKGIFLILMDLWFCVIDSRLGWVSLGLGMAKN